MRLLRILAFPVSLVYAAIVHLRNLLYDVGFFPSKKFTTPTICIGNLSTGGTGKTPMVTFLSEMLKDTYKIALLSRGYRRKSKGFVLADAASTVADLGDEPFQLKRKHAYLTVVVDADRSNGIKMLEEKVNPDVILLDDAFQHRKVLPQLSILLTAYDALYVDDWYLPTGNLRDAKNQSKRADVIAVTKCPNLLSKVERGSILKKLGPKHHQKVIFGTLGYSEFFTDGKTKISFDGIENKKCALVTGIANPEPLVSHLKGLGLVFEHLRFADHHFFSDKEINDFKAYEIILTTEKDYVRFGDRLTNAFYLEMGHVFSKVDTEILKKELIEAIKPHDAP
ncbi:tetraacyldisaccharide 4'-kinase [Allomuricauda sp. d1]|uniref:tetraacyldisaccharide 4'-kinase n=1 Tax=Allomuricauda sp. d1 TaxID=3136725 RepID=UPI0031D8E7E6